jgi:hypothetical protein
MRRKRRDGQNLDTIDLILNSIAECGEIAYFPDNGSALMPVGHRKQTDWVSSTIIKEFESRGFVTLHEAKVRITEAGRLEAGVPELPALSLADLG